MKVARWGNSLAVRLPSALVREMALKEGDEIDMKRGADGALEISLDRRKEEAMAAMRALSRPLPPGYKFDRDEIYDRFGRDSPGRKPYDD